MTFCYVLLPQLNVVSHLSDERASWIASINGIALPIGLLVTTPIMNKYGRKHTNLIRAVLTTVAWTCLSLTTDYYVILFCRFLQGICLGCAAILVPVLLGEYTSPNSVNVILVIFSPESPSFLAKKGNFNECTRAFNWLRYPNEVQELEKMIQTQMTAVNRKKEANVHDAFTKYIYERVIGDMNISLLISTDILRTLSALCAMFITESLATPDVIPADIGHGNCL
ncbi:facilitated trehalose transporter Tret1-like [Papilio machaon]|uniref:facilitated trehalose transporter Tret1-like n=1 Tax=Papilio machaon TaxID=76193 RepID=UPI001E663B97|nr:facilitated trehalose transporter Tret1-like [Papilio machaon]